DGWQRTVTTKYIKDFHDNASNPTETTRSVTYRVNTTVTGVADNLVRVVSVEDQNDTYEYDFRLKTGYTKTLQIYTRLPGVGATLRPIQSETNQVKYNQLGTPGEFIKTYEITEVSGSTLKFLDNPADEGSHFTRTSLFQANGVGDIPDDAILETGRPIY